MELEPKKENSKFFNFLNIFKRKQSSTNMAEPEVSKEDAFPPSNISKNQELLNKQLEEERKKAYEELEYIVESGNSEQLSAITQSGVILPYYLLKKIIFEHENLWSHIDIVKHVEKYNDDIKVNLFDISKKIVDNPLIQECANYQFEDKNKNRIIILNSLAILNDFLFTSNSYNSIKPIKSLDFTNNEINNFYKNMVIIKADKDSVKSNRNLHSYYPCENKIENIYKFILGKYNYLNQEKVQNLGERLKALSLENVDEVKKSIEKNFMSQLRAFNENSLNEKSQSLFNEIKLIFIELQKNELPQLEKLELESIYMQKLPRIISEYVAIPPNFRKKMEQDNEGPDKLLEKSLTEIKLKLSEMSQTIQEENIKKMKVTHTYLKNSFGH